MLSPQRVIGILIVILALVIAIIPSLYNCGARNDEGTETATTLAGGMTATTMGGSTGTTQAMAAPMPCHYSARAAVLVAIPLGILGLLLLVSKRKETNRRARRPWHRAGSRHHGRALVRGNVRDGHDGL